MASLCAEALCATLALYQWQCQCRVPARVNVISHYKLQSLPLGPNNGLSVHCPHGALTSSVCLRVCVSFCVPVLYCSTVHSLLVTQALVSDVLNIGLCSVVWGMNSYDLISLPCSCAIPFIILHHCPHFLDLAVFNVFFSPCEIYCLKCLKKNSLNSQCTAFFADVIYINPIKCVRPCEQQALHKALPRDCIAIFFFCYRETVKQKLT